MISAFLNYENTILPLSVISDNQGYQSLAFTASVAEGEWRETQVYFSKNPGAAPVAKLVALFSTTDSAGNVTFTKSESNLTDAAPNGVTCTYYVKE